MQKPNKKTAKQIITLIVVFVFMAGTYGFFFVMNSLQTPEVELTQEELEELIESGDVKIEEVSQEEVESEQPEEVLEAKVEEPEMILFYSQSCPHCHNVLNYIKENKIDEKINIQQLDASGEYNELFADKVKECELDSQGYGVPFLYYNPEEKGCVMGDTPIIDFLNDYLSL